MSQVPVLSASGRIIQHLDADYAATLKGVKLERKGRGRGAVVRVRLLPLTAQVCELVDRTGRHFVQDLGGGLMCHALRGVIGSEDEHPNGDQACE